MNIGNTIEAHLQATNLVASFNGALVCTDAGLLMASSGLRLDDEALAGFVSLFDEIVVRAGRDLRLNAIDEVALLDVAHGRLVIRPITTHGRPRTFLVVSLPTRATWRRHTNVLLKRLREVIGPMIELSEDESEPGRAIS